LKVVVELLYVVSCFDEEDLMLDVVGRVISLQETV
jgi:hypothetical protein